jgi:hypothetical protein
MITNERCMKVNAMSNPPTLNKWPQEGQGTRGCGREDYTMNVRIFFNGHGVWSGKNANGAKKDERIGLNKLRGMGMMGGWMEAIA